MIVSTVAINHFPQHSLAVFLLQGLRLTFVPLLFSYCIVKFTFRLAYIHVVLDSSFTDTSKAFELMSPGEENKQRQQHVTFSNAIIRLISYKITLLEQSPSSVLSLYLHNQSNTSVYKGG